MRPSLRFLALAVVGWAGLRAATLDKLPGAEIFQIEPSAALQPPPIAQTEFPPINPVEPSPAPESALAQMGSEQAAAGYPYGAHAPPTSRAQPVAIPYYYYPVTAPAEPPLPARRAALTTIHPEPAPLFYSSLPVLEDSPLSRIAATSLPAMRSAVVTPGQSLPVAARKPGLDRLQLTSWALLRNQQPGVVGSQSLANGGQLGGSQAGARLSYNFTPQIAAVVRTSSEVGRRGGELAAGVRIKPAQSIPIWFTAERRQRLGRYGGGRNAFAMFFEGGVWNKPLPWQFSLDAYLQAGVVGFRKRDGFIDGGLAATRPVYKQFSAGLGVWGGAQPGLYRVDAGPRVSMRVRDNVRVHVDWRQRVAGNAQPGSGPAITLAADF